MFFGEIIFGYTTHSIALTTDAFHMLSDIGALCIAHHAISLANRKTTNDRYTYGWQRAETLGALINAVFLLALCFTIILSAIERLLDPVPIENPFVVLIVGCAGLLVNFLGLLLFHEEHHDDHAHENIQHNIQTVVVMDESMVAQTHPQSHEKTIASGGLNMRGVFLHVMGDALGSIGVIITAIIIKWSKWNKSYYMDPITSIAIATLIVCTTWGLFRKTANIVLHVAPPHTSIENIRKDIVDLALVKDMHELHVWQLSDRKTVASVHVILHAHVNQTEYMDISTTIKNVLHRHKVHNTTIQLEIATGDSSSMSSDCLIRCADTACRVVTCCPAS